MINFFLNLLGWSFLKTYEWLCPETRTTTEHRYVDIYIKVVPNLIHLNDSCYDLEQYQIERIN